MINFTVYDITIISCGLIGFLILLQLIVADISGLKAQKKPGYSTTEDASLFEFRAHRALANTNESVAAFLALAIFGIFSAANPSWLNISAALYVGARILHMVFYYSGVQLPRSIAFGISLLAMLAMFVTGLLAWI